MHNIQRPSRYIGLLAETVTKAGGTAVEFANDAKAFALMWACIFQFGASYQLVCVDVAVLPCDSNSCSWLSQRRDARWLPWSIHSWRCNGARTASYSVSYDVHHLQLMFFCFRYSLRLRGHLGRHSQCVVRENVHVAVIGISAARRLILL